MPFYVQASALITYKFLRLLSLFLMNYCARRRGTLETTSLNTIHRAKLSPILMEISGLNEVSKIYDSLLNLRCLIPSVGFAPAPSDRYVRRPKRQHNLPQGLLPDQSVLRQGKLIITINILAISVDTHN